MKEIKGKAVKAGFSQCSFLQPGNIAQEEKGLPLEMQTQHVSLHLFEPALLFYVTSDERLHEVFNWVGVWRP